MKIKVFTENRSDKGLLEGVINAIKKDDVLKLVEEGDYDLLIVLGDRPAALKAATQAAENHIPVAHLSGGETTTGVIDNYVRDAITKMSHLHFTAADEYRRRVIRLGEHPDRVFWVGEPGLDDIKTIQSNGYRGYIVTLHPCPGEENVEELFHALETIQDYEKIIITSPQKDKGHEKIVKLAKEFAKKRQNTEYRESFESRTDYLQHMVYAKAIIGNSSSGIVEAASLATMCINIGDRQKGRLQGNNVINCKLDKDDILKAISNIRLIEVPQNPYYKDGKAVETIIRLIKQTDVKSLLLKDYYDGNW